MPTRARIYLDYNASAPLTEPARTAMVDALADLANPSSIHAEGRRARDRVERARRQVADLVGRPREHVVFNSGGTEANQLGVAMLARIAEARGLPRVVATSPTGSCAGNMTVFQPSAAMAPLSDGCSSGVVADDALTDFYKSRLLVPQVL